MTNPSSTRTQQTTLRLSEKTKADMDELCQAMGVKPANWMAQVISERVMKEKRELDLALRSMERQQDKIAEQMALAMERIMTNPQQLSMLTRALEENSGGDNQGQPDKT